jgi:transposase
MGKCFRADNFKQDLLLPPSLRDWLPEKHLAHFLADVVESLDLGAIYDSYEEKDGRGRAAYAPGLMVRLLLYGYCTGVYSSRKIETKTYEDIVFRYLAADEHPDHDTIAEFRKRHLQALSGLFVQVLQLCQKAGLVKLGHVAIDGSKIQANASKHKAMSYERMEKAEQQLREEVEAMMGKAAGADEAEDEKYGKGGKEEELPAELARRESRIEKIQAAKAALEAEAREKAEARKAEAEVKLAERAEEDGQSGKTAHGRKGQIPDPATARPKPKAQRNFTDPESRIMPDGGHKGSFVQGYNAQIAVDGQAQIIVAAEITQETNDKRQLAPMLAQVEKNTGSKPEAASADAGYCSEEQMADPRVQGVELYIATGKQKHGESGTEKEEAREAKKEESGPVSLLEAMKQKLKSESGRKVYRRRKAIVEPVFGQIKEQRGFRRFLLRGFGKVREEWKLICLSHNLLKLFRVKGAVTMA